MVQQSIQDEKDEISKIENRMAARKQKFQEECLDIRARKEEVEMRIKDVTNKGVMDRRHMSSGNIQIFRYLLPGTYFHSTEFGKIPVSDLKSGIFGFF